MSLTVSSKGSARRGDDGFARLGFMRISDLKRFDRKRGSMVNGRCWIEEDEDEFVRRVR